MPKNHVQLEGEISFTVQLEYFLVSTTAIIERH